LDANKLEELKAIVREKGIVVKDKITLSSGEESVYYYDLKKVSFDPVAIKIIGDLLLEQIVLKYGKVKSVGGLASGAVSLVTAIVMKSYGNDSGINGFFIRKERKPHGLQKIIEGEIKEPVVIVDDVMTTGGSIRLAIDTVREAGFDVKGVLTLLDREEDNELRKTIKCFSLLKHSDFKSFIEEQVKKNKNAKIGN